MHPHAIMFPWPKLVSAALQMLPRFVADACMLGACLCVLARYACGAVCACVCWMHALCACVCKNWLRQDSSCDEAARTCPPAREWNRHTSFTTGVAECCSCQHTYVVCLALRRRSGGCGSVVCVGWWAHAPSMGSLPPSPGAADRPPARSLSQLLHLSFCLCAVQRALLPPAVWCACG